MGYSIFEAGNLVASFDHVDAASEGLTRLAAASPEACDGLLLVAFDDAGNVIAECAPGEPVVTAA